jgi:hypothetical protein
MKGQARRPAREPRRSKWTRVLTRGVFLAGAWTASSCAPSGFANETIIATVRILASSSEPVYAQPGDMVTARLLAVDGRPSEQMKVYWIPRRCENPLNDAYFACFQQLGYADAGAGDAGDAGTGLPQLEPGLDITLGLPTGPSYPFTIPPDVVSNHAPVSGEPSPYGLVIVFNVACAGTHIKVLAPNGDNPQQVPIGCFDDAGTQLGPDDSVFGFTRIYAFDPDAGPGGGPVINANPVITSVDVAGSPLAVMPDPIYPDAGETYTTPTFTTPHCAAGCPQVSMGPVVPSSSWEVTQQVDMNGNPEHEEIWTDVYSTFGQFSSSASLLYDATKGSIGAPSVTDVQFTPPNDPGTGFIWMVVHDDRGGAAWVTIPVVVQ